MPEGNRPSIAEQRYAVRQQGLATGRTKLGGATFHTVSRPAREFSLALQRCREIETLIKSRHGMTVPDPAGTDDGETCLAYAVAIAGALAGQDLVAWAGRWMPWATTSELERIGFDAGWRKYLMRADDVAALLGVDMAEREALGLRTIGARDMSKRERGAQAKQAKQRRDRERQAAKRRAAGMMDRAEFEALSLSKARPWEAEGISRRTWERRRAAGVASPSRVVEKDTIGDRHATRRSSVKPLAKGAGAPDARDRSATPHGETMVAANTEPHVSERESDPHRIRDVAKGRAA